MLLEEETSSLVMGFAWLCGQYDPRSYCCPACSCPSHFPTPSALRRLEKTHSLWLFWLMMPCPLFPCWPQKSGLQSHEAFTTKPQGFANLSLIIWQIMLEMRLSLWVVHRKCDVITWFCFPRVMWCCWSSLGARIMHNVFMISRSVFCKFCLLLGSLFLFISAFIKIAINKHQKRHRWQFVMFEWTFMAHSKITFSLNLLCFYFHILKNRE